MRTWNTSRSRTFVHEGHYIQPWKGFSQKQHFSPIHGIGDNCLITGSPIWMAWPSGNRTATELEVYKTGGDRNIPEKVQRLAIYFNSTHFAPKACPCWIAMTIVDLAVATLTRQRATEMLFLALFCSIYFRKRVCTIVMHQCICRNCN